MVYSALRSKRLGVTVDPPHPQLIVSSFQLVQHTPDMYLGLSWHPQRAPDERPHI